MSSEADGSSPTSPADKNSAKPANVPATDAGAKEVLETSGSDLSGVKKTITTPIENVGSFAPGVDERCMWCDPFSKDNRLSTGAVLLGDVIKKYVFDFNILVDKSSYEEGKIKGGGYTMTPDENGAWMFVGDGKDAKKVELERSRDQIGDYYVVPPNSLVYIKIKQELRLPFYLIGRHNLKIRYVYKGLLLGTGPQVDPGFEGNLFIPLRCGH